MKCNRGVAIITLPAAGSGLRGGAPENAARGAAGIAL